MNKAIEPEASLPVFYLSWDKKTDEAAATAKSVIEALPSNKLVIFATMNTTAIAAYLSQQYKSISSGLDIEIIYTDDKERGESILPVDASVTVTDMTFISLEALDTEIQTDDLLLRWLKFGQEVSEAGMNVTGCFAMHRCLTGLEDSTSSETGSELTNGQLHGSFWGLVKSLRVDSKKIFNALCVDFEHTRADVSQHCNIAQLIHQ